MGRPNTKLCCKCGLRVFDWDYHSDYCSGSPVEEKVITKPEFLSMMETVCNTMSLAGEHRKGSILEENDFFIRYFDALPNSR